MKIVIDIPDEDYQIALTKLMLEFKGCSITTLPKGHGRLIDADAILEQMRNTFDMQELYLPIHLKELVVDDAPTIIEADKDCKVCRHSEETDGFNCYECAKEIKDNFEADKEAAEL